MKHFYFLLLLMVPLLVRAQFLSSMNISPSPTLACSTTVVTLNGEMGCINGIFNGTNLTITGNNIFVDLDVTQPFICAPVIVPITGTVNLNNLTPGTYTVNGRYVENGNVTAVIQQTLVVNSCCSINTGIVAADTTLCVGDSAMLMAADPSLLSISWKLNGSLISADDSIDQVYPSTGSYEYTLIGNDGSCIDSSSLTIQVGNYPVVSFTTLLDEGCPGKENGSIGATASLGNGPYTYSWSNGASGATIGGLAAGTYTVTATDAYGCETADSATISAGPPVFASFAATDSFICQGDVVNFTNTSSGTNANLWYLDGNLTSATNDLQQTFTTPGTYEVKLLALSVACEDSAFLTVTVSDAPQVSFSITPPSCPSSSDGAIDLSFSQSPFPPYTILWWNGASSTTLTQVSGGSFPVTLIDSIGCTYMDTVTVVPDSGIQATFTASDSGLVCLGSSIQLNSTTIGATSQDWWVNGASFGSANTETYTFADTGSYVISFLVTDGNCSDTADISFTVPALPSTEAAVTGETCRGDEDGAIDLTVSGGTAPYSFAWDNGATTEDLTGLAPGQYTVTITDAEGCEAVDTMQVENLGSAMADFTFSDNGLSRTFMDLSINAVSWNWDFGDGTGTSTAQNPTYTYQFNGSYEVTLVVVSPLGCADTLKWTLECCGNLAISPEAIASIVIFPNPTNSLISIDLGNFAGQEANTQVLDMMGKQVLVHTLRASADVELDLSSLAAGVYTVLIEIDGSYLVGRVKKE